MMTDIVADRAEMKPIKEIAAQIGLGEDDIEQYGKYKANHVEGQGPPIRSNAGPGNVNQPTPAGEGNNGPGGTR